MRFGMGLAILAIVVAAAGAPAHAVVCMNTSMTVDEVVDAIGATPGCERAMAIFKDCQLVASGDVAMGAAVEKKCEADFMPRLTGATKKAYRRRLSVCDGKYRNEQGTMYLSFTAFCRAEIAQRYSRRARKR
jgi:hypothetical protein